MSIKSGNKLFINKDYKKALIFYRETLIKGGPLAKIAEFNIKITNKKISKAVTASDRCAIFAGYSENAVVKDYVVYYLKKLRDVCNYIVYVTDNVISHEESNKLNGLVDHLICKEHGEYDFGSYKRGYEFLKQNDLLSRFKTIIFCNDSCYGPMNGFSDLFKRMENTGVDFWGLASNTEFENHIQSYFISFKDSVFQSKIFSNFLSNVKKETNVKDVILNYETKWTKLLNDAGFIWQDCIIRNNDYYKNIKKNTNLTVFPIYMLKNGCELVKVKAFKKISTNADGILETAAYIKQRNPKLLNLIENHLGIHLNNDSSLSFSIILPTYNRSKDICRAIDSVLAQNYQNYELIIVDDGSNDGTSDLIHSKYNDEIKSGRIVYLANIKNVGVSYARNKGLKHAKNNWIAYLDSDNELLFNYLTTFVDAIISQGKNGNDVFYASFKTKSNMQPNGREFDAEILKCENYIDLGVFVHNRKYINICTFDERLRRLVDWDFVLQVTSNSGHAVYLPYSVMIYNDLFSADRISIKNSYPVALNHIKHKHHLSYKISAVILAYNHENSLEEAIESACKQIVDKFEYEIIIFDDCSNDKTWDVVSKMASKYPTLIKGCRNPSNLGQGLNFKNAIGAARGDFIALLEGDDKWIDPYKLSRQADFLINNIKCSMVFSKIIVRNEILGTDRYLNRQNCIVKTELTADDFFNHESLNLLGTFSTCMFRRFIVEKIPKEFFLERISEITVAFHAFNYGSIGYIDDVMTMYTQHENGLWSGSHDLQQLEMWTATRIDSIKVAPQQFKEVIKNIIKKRFSQLPEDVSHAVLSQYSSEF